MRAVLFVSSLAVLATPSLAQDADAPVEEDRREVRKCIAPQVIVPTFNNTPEAMEQSRIAATIVAGDVTVTDPCKCMANKPAGNRPKTLADPMPVASPLYRRSKCWATPKRSATSKLMTVRMAPVSK